MVRPNVRESVVEDSREGAYGFLDPGKGKRRGDREVEETLRESVRCEMLIVSPVFDLRGHWLESASSFNPPPSEILHDLIEGSL